MKKILAIAIIAVSSISHAQTVADWTPYLSDIKHNCWYPTLHKLLQNNQLPKSLKPSIKKRTGHFLEEDANLALELKNASTFGQPLTKITYVGDIKSATLTLHFANADFMKLLPTFSVGDGQRQEKAGTKHFWVSELTLAGSDDDKAKVLSTHNLNYQDGKKWWQEYNSALNIQNTAENSYLMGYQTTNTGYRSGNYFADTTLTFDPRAKTITCESFGD